ncbi:hypothetical protein Pan153_62850 [Gimesia panareensis]|uniref:Uncharacterized protein n=1 Tax=Gimesia panareensis TaxID=2527978 RepID=A0A518FZ06_9PLAN|nr:hypothetical protein [Gimesia panareensis]QDV21595.1 hypothetical protein Pan153_62850 [Gimesia panareensis]
MELPYDIEVMLTRPGMCLSEVSYDSAVAYLMGANMTCHGGILHGFQEWLMIKIEIDTNLMWSELVLHFALPNSESPRDELEKLSDHKPLISFLHQMLKEFWRERNEKGLRIIFLNYEKWLRKRDWYDPTSSKWFDWE